MLSDYKPGRFDSMGKNTPKYVKESDLLARVLKKYTVMYMDYLGRTHQTGNKYSMKACNKAHKDCSAFLEAAQLFDSRFHYIARDFIKSLTPYQARNPGHIGISQIQEFLDNRRNRFN